jgi:hypothetical protein
MDRASQQEPIFRFSCWTRTAFQFSLDRVGAIALFLASVSTHKRGVGPSLPVSTSPHPPRAPGLNYGLLCTSREGATDAGAGGVGLGLDRQPQQGRFRQGDQGGRCSR